VATGEYIQLLIVSAITMIDNDAIMAFAICTHLYWKWINICTRIQ